MFISGLTQFVPTDKETHITEDDKKAFVKATLELSHFRKQFNYGGVQIHCVSPNLSEYAVLENNPEGFDYEDCFTLVVLEKIIVNGNTIYQKTQDIVNDYNNLKETLNGSPALGFVAKSVTRFYALFKELMKRCGEPDFFG